MFSESKVTEIYCMADDFFVTGKILKLINYHEKQNSFGGSFTAGDINY